MARVADFGVKIGGLGLEMLLDMRAIAGLESKLPSYFAIHGQPPCGSRPKSHSRTSACVFFEATLFGLV